MGIYKKGILGPFAGKVGTVVGRAWRGEPVMASLPVPSALPPTTAQENVQNVFRFLGHLSSFTDTFIGYGYWPWIGNKPTTPTAQFVKDNWAAAWAAYNAPETFAAKRDEFKKFVFSHPYKNLYPPRYEGYLQYYPYSRALMWDLTWGDPVLQNVSEDADVWFIAMHYPRGEAMVNTCKLGEVGTIDQNGPYDQNNGYPKKPYIVRPTEWGEGWWFCYVFLTNYSRKYKETIVSKTRYAGMQLIQTTVNNLDINITPAGAGTTGGAGIYADMTEATITASANRDWRFKRWVYDTGQMFTDNPHTFTICRDITITAEFEENITT